MLIKGLGCAVERFSSAEEFILSPKIACTSCLVVNVQLPGMNGLQLQSHLVSAGRHIPIVFIVASATAEAIARARELGAVNILEPRGQKALLEEISSYLKPKN